jgi:RNA polymerase sigma-70 factor (ECF subfamily)
LASYPSISDEELILACAELNDGAAWQEFVSRFRRPIALSITRIAWQWGAMPHQIVDDLVQETYLKLCTEKCRLLCEFTLQHPGAALGYIKTVAVNVAHDHFKSLHSQKRGSGVKPQSIGDAELRAHGWSLGSPDAMEREILLKEVDRCLESGTTGPDQDRDRLIFWLHFQQGLSANAIAGLPTVDLTTKGVESAISRLSRLVREQVAGLKLQTSVSPPSEEKGFRPAESY